ncbi:hypothetical protein FV228_00015 [Methylobacterium sp. WL18]|uniref:hypothetical protein n=1 Tax=Methylobacterium sp. WL18 TaxID=2603897 RepID=UPI0011C878DE|nr:hypothetical protein [Methylobacterium sp. WL18]TXN76575.1 hypothetical protein FV228_00015 [Methylobacterium sp. WL18]
MTLAAETAAVKMPQDATWDPEFTGIFICDGLEAALRHLADRHDLDDVETMAVTATIMELISVEQA